MDRTFLQELNIQELNSGAASGGFLDRPREEGLASSSPIDGQTIARVGKRVRRAPSAAHPSV